MKNYNLLIPLLFFLCVQNYAQWEATNFPSTFKVTSLAIKDSMIFAGTIGDGIFVSTDNGDNWNRINEGLKCKVVQTIFINENPPPGGQTTIFAGTGTGAYVSKNNGLTWSTTQNGLTDEGIWSFAACEVTADYTTLFAGTWSGRVYKSTDNGTGWFETNFSKTIALIDKSQTHFPDPSLVTVCPMIAVGKEVYAATIGGRLLKSLTNGEDWREISFMFFEGTDLSGLLPVYSLGKINSTIVAGIGDGNIAHKLTNSSDSFLNSINGNITSYPILSFAGHDGKIFAGNSHGQILISEDEGVNWEIFHPSDFSLYKYAFYSLAVNNSYIFAGTNNGIWRFKYPENVTAVDEFNETPAGFTLEQNYPNPFNSGTKIKFTIPKNTFISLKVYNILGELIKDLVNGNKSAGTYEVDFSPVNLQSGIYFYSLTTNEFRSTKKLILLK